MKSATAVLGRCLGPCLCLCLGVAPARGQAPRAPFSGVYGATAGTGSIAGWDRSGGENPAVVGAPGWMASVAGYAPFGLDGLRVTEAVVAWDRARWGVSGSYRGMFADAEAASSAASTGFAVQSALKLGHGVTTGIAGAHHRESGSGGAAGGFGVLWRPRPWGSLGAFWNREASSRGDATRAGAGVEGGGALAGVAWRLCAEGAYAAETGNGRWETRLGAGLRLHALLSVYAGWDRARATAALGVRFGIGEWEGFSAMRRHASLGGTSVQGIRWRHD